MIYAAAFAATAALGSLRGAIAGGSASLATNQVYSTAALRRIDLAAFRQYAEGLIGAVIALAGVALWLWPTT